MHNSKAVVVGDTFASRARRRRIFFVRSALLFSDLVAFGGAATMATFLRFGGLLSIEAAPRLTPGLGVRFAEFSGVLVALWIAAMWFEELYDVNRLSWGTGEYKRVLRALSFGVAALIILTYVLYPPGISRVWVALAWSFGIAFTIVSRSLVRLVLAELRRHGHLLRPTLIVGHNEEAAELTRRLLSDSAHRLVPVAYLTSALTNGQSPSSWAESLPCIGSVGDIKRILGENLVDTVVIASTALGPDAISHVISEMRGLDVDIEMSSGLLDVMTSRIQVREVSGVPLITIRSVSFTAWQRLIKRAFDLLLGGLTLLLGIPLWALIALLIKTESGGPVFYKQTRVGRGGEAFEMLKFRSMTRDAHSRRHEVAHGNEASDPLFKMHGDPRVTRVGKWLRKFSLDEFPQLINVLKGEMSLVGPRPPLPEESAQYSEYHWRRMEVVPGMTGLWQVSGRSLLTFDEMVRLDLFYIENWTVSFDLSILVRTVPAVFLARGSY